MSLKMNSNSRAIVAILVIVAAAIAFWMLALGPKREEASELSDQLEAAELVLADHRAQVAEGLEARKAFPVAYQRLVVLGKAVPGDDDVASLLVQVNRISDAAGTTFAKVELSAAVGEGEPVPAAPEPGSTTTISATEASAAVLPLGASIGPAGLAVMPYSLRFDGNFFGIADFIEGLDDLVGTGKKTVAVDGRLVTIDGFALAGDRERHFPYLKANFSVTTYLAPPSQGVTGGATPQAPAPAGSTQVSATIGESP